MTTRYIDQEETCLRADAGRSLKRLRDAMARAEKWLTLPPNTKELPPSTELHEAAIDLEATCLVLAQLRIWRSNSSKS